MLLRNFAQVGFLLFLLGLSRAGFVFSLSVIDSTTLDFSMLPKSSGHPGLVLSVFNFADVELLLFVRSFICVELACSVVGLARIGSVYSLSVLDKTTLEPLLFVQSFSCLGFALPVLSFSTVSSSLPLRSISCLGFSVLVFGKSQFELSVSALDWITVGFPISVQSRARTASYLFVLSFGHLGLSLLPKSFS